MHSNSFPEYIPGVYVINESRFDWGLGQIQSSIKNKITINFENVGKKTINPKNQFKRFGSYWGRP